MNWAVQCAVVIPCCNEAAHIRTLIANVTPRLPHVIVIDDGSIDATAREALRGGATVVCHDFPHGKGAALQAGWQCAREQGFRWVLCLDGDGQHDPAEIPRFLQRAEECGASLVIGNRMHAAASMPIVRRITNQWMSRRLSRMTGVALPDSQCGYRLMRLDVLDRVELTTECFEIESEQLLEFVKAGERIEFVPVPVIYRSEQSKIRPLRDTLRWFRWLNQRKHAHLSARIE